MGSRNGNIRRSLELGRLLSPKDVETLRLGRTEVLLGLAESDEERALVTECLASGWEERPAQTRLYNRLALRVVHEEDREVLARAEHFRRLLPDPLPEIPVDPELEQLILDQAAKRAAAEAALDAVRRQWDNGRVELSKLQQRDPKGNHAVLRAQVTRLQEDVEAARDEAEKQAGRLAQYLTIRADRHRAFALAAATR